MEKPFLESWHESSQSLAGLCRNISDKNMALTQALCTNLASKQWSKMTQAAIDMTKDFNVSEVQTGKMPKFTLLSESEIQSIRDLCEIYQAVTEKTFETQLKFSKTYFELCSDYSENLKKSRDLDDVVASNFDLIGNLLLNAKNFALDALEIQDASKFALVAWSENRPRSVVKHPAPASVH